MCYVPGILVVLTNYLDCHFLLSNRPEVFPLQSCTALTELLFELSPHIITLPHQTTLPCASTVPVTTRSNDLSKMAALPGDAQLLPGALGGHGRLLHLILRIVPCATCPGKELAGRLGNVAKWTIDNYPGARAGVCREMDHQNQQL